MEDVYDESLKIISKNIFNVSVTKEEKHLTNMFRKKKLREI